MGGVTRFGKFGKVWIGWGWFDARHKFAVGVGIYGWRRAWVVYLRKADP